VNTEGHADVAESAGIPLLREAFGEKDRSLDALELGNWLTDVSQLLARHVVVRRSKLVP
jgi:hypothetical protein